MRSYTTQPCAKATQWQAETMTKRVIGTQGCFVVPAFERNDHIPALGSCS
jgi:hypothetical protein